VTEDGQLLRQYARQGSQAAFSQLVARHLNLVYSVCLREVRDAALAEDVTQVVFLLLARKAPTLGPDTQLTGWLFQTARFACKNALRRETRRKLREQKAGEQMLESHDENALWDSIEPGLNDALASLGAKDREAVLLRFADGLSFPELGAALGTSEDAARMRLNRAVDRLRRFFAKGGVTLTGAALVGLLADRTTQAAPAICRDAVTRIGLGAISPQVSLQLQGAVKVMQLMNLKTAMLIALVGIAAAVTGFGVVRIAAAPSAANVARAKVVKPKPLPKEIKGTTMNTPVTIVQQYLDACAAKRYKEAYQLLSPASQQRLPLELFQQIKQWPTDPTADGMTRTLTAVSALFVDAPRSAGYHFTVIGASPDDPNTVLVQAQPPKNVSKGVLPLKIAVTRVPSPDGQPLLDMMKSYQVSDPEGSKQAAQWAEDRAKQ